MLRLPGNLGCLTCRKSLFFVLRKVSARCSSHFATKQLKQSDKPRWMLEDVKMVRGGGVSDWWGWKREKQLERRRQSLRGARSRRLFLSTSENMSVDKIHTWVTSPRRVYMPPTRLFLYSVASGYTDLEEMLWPGTYSQVSVFVCVFLHVYFRGFCVYHHCVSRAGKKQVLTSAPHCKKAEKLKETKKFPMSFQIFMPTQTTKEDNHMHRHSLTLFFNHFDSMIWFK